MAAIKAIFFKQLDDFPKNISVSLLYFMYPVMAFIMGIVIGSSEVYAGMFGAMFIGVIPMVAISMTVSEDKEYKSLRFLVIAGVKPFQYLFGLTSFVFIASLLPILFFVLLGGFSGIHLAYFLIASFFSLIASCALGATIGIFAKNVQQATAIYTPLMLALMLIPMLASFSEMIARVAEFLFVFQILLVALNPEHNMARAFIIIAINMFVLIGLFAVIYKKKGLRG